MQMVLSPLPIHHDKPFPAYRALVIEALCHWIAAVYCSIRFTYLTLIVTI